MSQVSRRRIWVFYFLGISLSGLYLVAFIELMLYAFAPQPLGKPAFQLDVIRGAIPTPNSQSHFRQRGVYDYVVETNDFGFRLGPSDKGRVQRLTTFPEDLNVLMLGDSFVFGTGLKSEETIGEQATKLLNSDQVFRWRLINAGNPGTGPDYSLRLWETLGADINPDIALYFFYANDYMDIGGERYYQLLANGELQVKDLSETLAFFRDKERFSRSAVYRWLCEHSQIVGLLRRAWAYRQLAGGLPWRDLLWPDYKRDTSLERGIATDSSKKLMRVYLERFQRDFRKAGVCFAIVHVASPVDIMRARQKLPAHPDLLGLREITQSLKIPLIESSGAVDSAAPLEQLFLRDGHWSPLMAKQAAGQLSNFLSDSEFCKERKFRASMAWHAFREKRKQEQSSPE